MPRIVWFLLLAVSPTLMHAQFYDAHWASGSVYAVPQPTINVINYNVFPFSTYTFVGNTGMSAMNLTLSDRLGNFLLYSNGIRIVNSNHALMQNGDSLSWNLYAKNNYQTGSICYNCMLGIPSSQNDSLYYILHSFPNYDSIFGLSIRKVLYTIVDIGYNGGLGRVLSKNNELWNGVYIQELSACRHGNGRDWWVFAQEDTINAYHRALLGPEGFSNIDTQSIGYKQPWYSGGREGGGQNFFTPDGSKYIDFDSWNGIRIFDFNRCTGQLSNARLIAFPQRWSFGAGAAVSPNSRFLYVSSASRILQYDLWSPDIGSTGDTIGVRPPEGPGFANMDLMMDGRIYILPFSWSHYGHYIRYPNRKGAECELVPRGVYFPNANDASIPHFPNYRLGAEAGSPCDTLGITHKPLAWWRWDLSDTSGLSVIFTDNSWYKPESWHWDFDDPGSGANMSTDTNTTHVFSAPGQYQVCLRVCNAYGCDTMCRVLDVKTVGIQSVVSSEGVLLYPNPAGDYLNVRWAAYEPGAVLELRNMLGQLVLEAPLSGPEMEIGLGSVGNGLYVARIRRGGALQQLGKIVVARN